MGLISWLIVGLVIGVLARLFTPGRDPMGVVTTLLIGIAGAFVGGWVWASLFGAQQRIAWIGSIIAATALLWIYRRMMSRRQSTVW